MCVTWETYLYQKTFPKSISAHICNCIKLCCSVENFYLVLLFFSPNHADSTLGCLWHKTCGSECHDLSFCFTISDRIMFKINTHLAKWWPMGCVLELLLRMSLHSVIHYVTKDYSILLFLMYVFSGIKDFQWFYKKCVNSCYFICFICSSLYCF